MPDGEEPSHHAVEGPEEGLESVRGQSHEEPGLQARVETAERGRDAAEGRVAVLESREKELLDRLARLQADFDNFRRRTREEAAAATARGKEQAVRALLPALDSLELALEHAPDEGVRLVARQLEDALRSIGVVAIAPAIGEPFDAKSHEAIAKEAVEGVEAGAVARALARGYALDGRVLRPARVVVAE